MSSRIAFLFPGQGSQSVGMGQDINDRYPAAKALFEQADESLGFGLSSLCFDGPIEELTQTKNAQPALLLHSMAVSQIFAAANIVPELVAGHSLGEFSAAAAVGVMDVSDALAVVRRRGELMWQAGQSVPGTMAAVIGLDRESCERVCAASSEGVAVVANRNSPNQLVISGDVAALAALGPQLKEAGAKRVLPLNVSGAFHSPLMEVVQSEFSEFLDAIDFRDATAPVVTNVKAAPESDASELRAGFVAQLVSPVLWHDSVAQMVEAGIDCFVEIGPGKVLTNMGSRAFRDVQFLSTGDVDGIEKTLASLAS